MDLNSSGQTMTCSLVQLAVAYLTAKETVIELGYASEIDWQHSVSLDDLTEDVFLRETAWVILSAGMKESVIRQKFAAVTSAFCNWSTANEIVARGEQCKRRAMAAFANERKITAILRVAEIVRNAGFLSVKNSLLKDGVEYLQNFPFMGPITSFHLAKNLGIPVAKPDRHLVRVAKRTGFSSPSIMCQAIAQIVGDKISVIDLVIWRYATINRNYLSLFSI